MCSAACFFQFPGSGQNAGHRIRPRDWQFSSASGTPACYFFQLLSITAEQLAHQTLHVAYRSRGCILGTPNEATDDRLAVGIALVRADLSEVVPSCAQTFDVDGRPC